MNNYFFFLFKFIDSEIINDKRRVYINVLHKHFIKYCIIIEKGKKSNREGTVFINLNLKGLLFLEKLNSEYIFRSWIKLHFFIIQISLDIFLFYKKYL